MIKYKAVIAGSRVNEAEVIELMKALESDRVIPQNYHYLPRWSIEKTYSSDYRKKQLIELMIESDYLVTFDRKVRGLEVKYAISLNTKVVLVTAPPYRHYYFDYEDTYPNPEEKIECRRMEGVIELLSTS